MEENKGKPNEILKAMAITTTLGTELAICVVLGFYGGRQLDRVLDTGPWLMIIGILLGVVVGIWGIIKTMERFMKD